GYLSGHRTVSQAADDPVLASYLRHLWRHEIAPTLTAPPNTDLDEYAATLLGRFANPAIQHKTYQIAMDGSQKLPQRLLGTIMDRLKHGQNADALLLAVAGWMRFTGGIDETGATFEVQDPLAPALKAAQDADPATTVRNLLAVREIFDPTCAAQIEPMLVTLYQGLADHGARHMMAKLTG
ncbi:MAG: mannitol dehydrogenase family protein, partial [Sulfitobacter sp.]